MKKKCSYYKIKWTSFFATILIVSCGFLALYFKNEPAEPPVSIRSNEKTTDIHGFYSNDDFSMLIEENMHELGFLENIIFEGKSEGHYILQATLSNPHRFITICEEAAPYEDLLKAINGETVTINGHIGENESGNGCFITDSITFAGYTLPASFATPYIDQYTGLNALLEVPIDQIVLNETGVTFQKELPPFIQTASYTPPQQQP